jgi:hypothetical protein
MSTILHLRNCKCGKEGRLTKTDEWWVNAPEYYNCFWLYLKYNTRGHTLSEVAKLLRLSISAITSIEKKAFAKVRNKIKMLDVEK